MEIILTRQYHYTYDDKEYVIELLWDDNCLWIRITDSLTGNFSESRIDLDMYIQYGIAKLRG
jgi:hypothetical protein